MSSGTRTTSKGGKGAKAEKSNKNEKGDSGKGSSDKQQSRDTSSKSEDPSMKDKVKLLIEMSHKTEEEVCLALHECDNDANQAINMLLESSTTSEWETRVKKKKNRQASASKQDKSDEVSGDDGWNDGTPQAGGGNDKEKSRNKSGGPPRLHGRHNDSRGWRGREKQENERNLEDGGGRSDYGRDRRGRPGGSTRGGGGRGRGGGRAGGRYPPRGNRGGGTFSKPIDTWDNTWDNNTAQANNNQEENWDDFPGTDEWTTEEYTGSLADTKVFTPSMPPALDAPIDPTASQPVVPVDPSLAAAASGQQTLQISPQNIQMQSQSPVPIVGTLNAAQTQYLTQLTQQNSESMNKQYGSATATGGTTTQTFQSQTYDKTAAGGGQVYNSTTGGTQVYPNTQQYPPSNTYVANYQGVNNYSTPEQTTQQPVRTKTQRARVPPPSKIPASAVEMPGDLNSSIGYLDVQFGAMDFIDTNSFDGSETKFNTTANSLDSTAAPAANLDLNTSNQTSSLESYSPKTQNQSSISSALTQSISSNDNIPQTSEHMTGSYNTAPRSSAQGSTATPSATPSGLELNKQSDNHSYSQPSSYNSYQTKTNSYNTSTYNNTQTTTSSYVPNQSSNYVNNQSGTYNASSVSSYPNTYSSTTSYQSNTNAAAFPSISQANTYPSNNQSYPQNTSQSVYGANTGLNNSSTYGGGNTSTSQYNSYSNTTGSHNKLVKDSSSTYENTSSAASSSQTTTTNNVTSSTSTALSLSQSTSSTSKTTTTLVKNSSSVVSNIPPGVAPVMSTPYIMGQVPYFQQPVYSYEDVQLLQQRLPHMTTPYYDMSYQTPTTLAAVRDATLGNVGYSISDGRFTRGDNNASPVPSTLSQQTSTLTQGHQAQPILASGAPPYFFAPFNTIATNYQFGMYTQLPAATNAHGTSNSNQYPKPGAYSSGYGAYDALSQTQEYNKGSYVSNTQGQKGTGGNASSTGSAGNDLTAMYGKSHNALTKVNSYEKQGFHSGTPPPFTGLHGSQNAGLAPSNTGYAPQQVYIPTMAPHQQHHSTPLMHQPHMQMDVRHQGRRMDSGNSTGQRSQASNQAKAGAKQTYQTSYWNQA